MAELIVSTIAGNGEVGFVEGPVHLAQFIYPKGVAVSPDGAVYVADQHNHRIRVVKKGTVRTVAGCGIPGFADGPALQAKLNYPGGVAIGPDGAVYIADFSNCRIRMLHDGQLTTIAGCGLPGFADGPALQAKLHGPVGVAVAPDGVVYIVDRINQRIRALLTSGELVTVAGNGIQGFADGPALEASFKDPWSVSIASNRSIYIADHGNHRIRLLEDGELRTVAGSGDRGCTDGPALQARLNGPWGLVAGPNRTLFISDEYNGMIRILKDGRLSTLVGAGSQTGFRDGPASEARLNGPGGLACARDGTIYIADQNNQRIRAIPNAMRFLRRSWDQSSFSIESASKLFTDLEFPCALTTLKLHQCFVELRCPAMLASSKLKSQPLDSDALELFREYLYSDRLPDEASPKVYLYLAYIFEICKLDDLAFECLKKLRSIEIGHAERQLTPESLIALYGYALDLQPFDSGIRVLLYLLRKNKNSLDIPQLFQILSKQSQADVLNLMQSLVPDTPVLDPLSDTQSFEEDRTQNMSLKEAASRLFLTRRGADFEIVIGGDNTESQYVTKCHQFILHARWPYFATLNPNMREATERRLRLPEAVKDGGMHPVVLESLLEACYTGSLSEKTRQLITAPIALHVLAAEMYFKSGSTMEDDGETVAVDDPFCDLVAFAEQQAVNGLNGSNCLDAYKLALTLDLQDIASRAKEVLIQNRKIIFRDSQSLEQIRSLPPNVTSELLVEFALL